MKAIEIPRHPIILDADGFEQFKRYNLFRDLETCTIKFHNVVCTYGEDAGGYKTAVFLVSDALATIVPKGTRK